MERKILVAVDGSIYSRNALHYLATLFAGQTEISFHLLSVVSCPEAPPGSEWLTEAEIHNIVGPVTRRKLATRKQFTVEAVDFLVRGGIDRKRLSSEVRLAARPVADELLRTARKGLYDALLVGRRGLSKLEEIFMGSVSSALLEKCHDVPLWIIDGKVDSRSFLVPVDGSFASLMAVDHLAFILKGNPHARVTLFHSAAMLAQRPDSEPERFEAQWGKEWCAQHLERPDGLFHAPRQLLLENGFPEERISWLQTFKGIDPSRQILRQAMIDDFGTIVLGRRGDKIRKGIFKGVSDRVLFMAEQVAVWIVG